MRPACRKSQLLRKRSLRAATGDVDRRSYPLEGDDNREGSELRSTRAPLPLPANILDFSQTIARRQRTTSGIRTGGILNQNQSLIRVALRAQSAHPEFPI